MSRFKRQTNRGNWSPTTLKNAVQCKLDGMTYRECEKRFNIPKSTLQERVKAVENGQQLQLKPKLGRYNTTFTEQQENELNDHLTSLDSALMPLSKAEFLKLAYDYAEQLQIPHNFSSKIGKAGDSFYNGFMKRHEHLSLRKAQAVSMDRAQGFNEDALEKFYDKLILLMEEHQFTPSQIYNADETGISTAHKHSKVISIKGKKEVGKLTSADKGQNITVMLCGNANGDLLPPFFIFKEGPNCKRLLNGAPTGSQAFFGNSGWMTGDGCYEWLQFFIEKTKPSPENPVLLLVDGHSSHKRLDVLNLAREQGVHMLSFPPHTTHKLQPMDRAFMKPFKTAYNANCELLLRQKAVNKIIDMDVAGVVNAVLNDLKIEKKRRIKGKIVTINIPYRLTSGFAATGIVPLNRDKFKDDAALKSRENNTETETREKAVLNTLMPVPERPKVVKKMGTSEILTSASYIENVTKRQKVPAEEDDDTLVSPPHHCMSVVAGPSGNQQQPKQKKK